MLAVYQVDGPHNKTWHPDPYKSSRAEHSVQIK